MTEAIVTDLDAVRLLATAHQDAFDVMRYMLQLDDDLSDEAMDNLVERIAEPVIKAIDCTQCGNCCRSLHVYLTESDAVRLAEALGKSTDAIVDTYIDQESAQAEGEWGRFAQRPCALLKGNLCSIYAHRPNTCRAYPQFTPDFRWLLPDIIEGASLCPIIYNVLVRLLPLVDEGIEKHI